MSAIAPSTEDNAPAKLNLYLHMVGRRADGYHLLESLVAFTRSGDRLRAEPAATLSLTLDGPFADTLRATPDEDNLVLKAARSLAGWAKAHHRPITGARLVLTKNLPVASGIGGGSADAAATLTALRRLWALPISDEDLAGLAEALGADIPACIAGRPALMEGIGERLTALPALPPVPVLLVNPGLPLPTPAVYRAFREGHALSPTPRPKPAGPFRDARALTAALADTRNDLEAPAIALCPAIGEVLTALRQSGALFARMSGSGATCFALYDEADGAQAAATRLAGSAPSWWVMTTALRGAA